MQTNLCFCRIFLLLHTRITSFRYVLLMHYLLLLILPQTLFPIDGYIRFATEIIDFHARVIRIEGAPKSQSLRRCINTITDVNGRTLYFITVRIFCVHYLGVT